MMEMRASNHLPQPNDFCRICLLQKTQLRSLSSQTETVMIPEMIYKLTGTMLNMNEQLPRVICERCFIKLELAFTISEEFRKQEELLRSLWWKGALVDQLVAYGKEFRQSPYSEVVIERLEGEQREPVEPDFGTNQDDRILPVEQRRAQVKPEPLDATAFSFKIVDYEKFQENSFVKLEEESTGQLHDISDNGLKMVLELEDLQTIGALPPKLLDQLDRYGSPADEATYSVNFLSESEEDQIDDDKGTDYVPDPDDDYFLLGSEPEQNASTGDDQTDKTGPSDLHFAPQEDHKLSRQDEPGQGTGKFQCQYCQKRYPMLCHLKKHVGRHEKLRAAGIPERNLNGAYKCHVCGRRFADKFKFNDHMRKHKDVANGRFRCKICGHSFSGKTELTRHEYKHETNMEFMLAREKMTPPIEVTKNDKTVYKCGECQSMYKSRSHYFLHAKRHFVAKVGLYQCQDCGKRYKIKTHLRHHQRTVHKLFMKAEPDNEAKATEAGTGSNAAAEPAPVDIGKRLPYCSECDAYFLNLLNYGVHMRVHEGVATESSPTNVNQEPSVSLKFPVTVAGSKPSWYCNECGATFSSYRYLNDHQRRHINLQNIMFKCDLCKIAFTAHYELSRHRTGSHGLKTSAKRDRCPSCNKLVRKERLMQHLKEHENIQLKRYVCKKCGTAFGSPYNMKEHMAANTCDLPKSVKPLLPTRADAVTLLELQEDGSYGCKMCHKTFKGFTSAAGHAKRHMIMEAGIYKCEICQKAFGTKLEQDQHMKNIH